MERMARKLLYFRPTIEDDEASAYAAQKEPEIDIEHLSEMTRSRIENLDELLEVR
jgi:hypothetical protein